MSQRSAKIIDCILKKASTAIGKEYNLNPDELYFMMSSIPKTLECDHVLTRGKRKGKKCGVVLCIHHQKNSERFDKRKEGKHLDYSLKLWKLKKELREEEERKKIIENMTPEEKEKYDMDEAIRESIMYANINKYRMEQGMHMLRHK